MTDTIRAIITNEHFSDPSDTSIDTDIEDDTLEGRAVIGGWIRELLNQDGVLNVVLELQREGD